MRLSILCDAIRRDVFADEIYLRATAFVLDEDIEKEDEDEDFAYESESSLIDEDEIITEEARSEANQEESNIDIPSLAMDPNNSGRQVLEIATVSSADCTAIVVADEGIVGGNKTEIMSLKPFE